MRISNRAIAGIVGGAAIAAFTATSLASPAQAAAPSHSRVAKVAKAAGHSVWDYRACDTKHEAGGKLYICTKETVQKRSGGGYNIYDVRDSSWFRRASDGHISNCYDTTTGGVDNVKTRVSSFRRNSSAENTLWSQTSPNLTSRNGCFHDFSGQGGLPLQSRSYGEKLGFHYKTTTITGRRYHNSMWLIVNPSNFYCSSSADICDVSRTSSKTGLANSDRTEAWGP